MADTTASEVGVATAGLKSKTASRVVNHPSSDASSENSVGTMAIKEPGKALVRVKV